MRLLLMFYLHNVHSRWLLSPIIVYHSIGRKCEPKIELTEIRPKNTKIPTVVIIIHDFQIKSSLCHPYFSWALLLSGKNIKFNFIVYLQCTLYISFYFISFCLCCCRYCSRKAPALFQLLLPGFIYISIIYNSLTPFIQCSLVWVGCCFYFILFVIQRRILSNNTLWHRTQKGQTFT